MKKFSLMASLIALFSVLTLSSYALTTSGVISKEETWSGEITLTGDVTVSSGGKLTILPGTIVKCQPKADKERIQLIIDGGELVASGTEAEHITFTSASDNPQKGDWYGIRHIKGMLTLQYCDESWGSTGLRVEAVPKAVEYCSFSNNLYKGAWFSFPSRLVGCNFENNSEEGVYFEASIRMQSCKVCDNGRDGVYSGYSGKEVSATLNECVITRNGKTGVLISGDNKATAIVSNCEITGNGGYGVYVRGEYTNTATITNCSITDNKDAGIQVRGYYREGQWGLPTLRSASTVTVSNCAITGNGGAGVEVTVGDTNTTVSNCAITLNGGHGVQSDTVSVTDSVIGENIGAGVSLKSIGSKGFTNNRISANGFGVEIQSSGKITGNDIFGNMIYDLKNSGKSTIIADDNYWGEPTTTELKDGVANLTMIYDKQDDPSIGSVTISKYLTEPVLEDEEIQQIPQPLPPATCKGAFTLRLKEGLNMISLPVKPDTPYTARSFFEKLNATVIVKYDTGAGKFTPFIPDLNEGDGFEIECGQGYIVNVSEDKEVLFEGTVCSNAPSISTVRSLPNSTWAFLVGGIFLSEDGKPAYGEYFVACRNLRTGKLSSDMIGSYGEGKFISSFVDLAREDVVETGDIIELEVLDGRKKVVAGPIRHSVSKKEIDRAYALVELRLGKLIPDRTCLLQNYPNPFNPETWIPFKLAKNADVTIRIYDVQGRLVRELALGRLEAGIYEQRDKTAYWDGRNGQGEQVSSGVYIIELSTAGFRAVRKACLMK